MRSSAQRRMKIAQRIFNNLGSRAGNFRDGHEPSRQCPHYGAFVVNIRAGINSPRSGEPRDPLFVCHPQGRVPDCLFGCLQRDGTKHEERLPLELATVEGCKRLPVKFRRTDPQRPEKAAWLTFESFGNASTMKAFMIIEQGTNICIRIVRTS